MSDQHPFPGTGPASAGPGPAADAGDEGAAEQLESELDEARRKAEEYLADLRRVAADFENYRKRVARESALALQRGVAKLAKELLPAIDNLDRALEAAQTSYAGQPLLEGMILVRTQLLQTLQDEGLDRIPVLGLPFDPAVAESVSTAPVKEAEQHHVVVKELLRGYRLNGRVARPSHVVIGHFEAAPSAEAAAPPAAAPPNAPEPAAAEPAEASTTPPNPPKAPSSTRRKGR